MKTFTVIFDYVNGQFGEHTLQAYNEQIAITLTKMHFGEEITNVRVSGFNFLFHGGK